MFKRFLVRLRRNLGAPEILWEIGSRKVAAHDVPGKSSPTVFRSFADGWKNVQLATGIGRLVSRC